jgi:ABC-type multidrug transport system fused ATPase/permease subunit
MVLVSLLDGIGIFLLIPIINISGIINLNNEGSNITSLFSFLHSVPEKVKLPIAIGIFLLIVIGQTILQRNLNIRNIKIQQSFFRQLRLESFRELLEANWSFYIKKRKSDLINILTSELARINSGTNQILQLITAIVFTLIQIGIAFWLSAMMTSFVLFCGVILMIFSRKFIKRAKSLGNYTSRLGQSYLSGITDNFNGIKDIKSNTLESSQFVWFRSITEGILSEQIEYIKLRSSSEMFYKIISAILISFFIFLSIKLFHAQAAQLFIITLIFSRLWPRFTGIQANLQQIASIVPAFKALIDLQNECKEAKEWNIKNIDSENIDPILIKNGIECSQVFFRYDKNEPTYTLNEINLIIPANRMTAIVGRSGAGKSTLIDLLMGLLKPERGQIIIDGSPLSQNNLLSLRQSISYVPQDPFLFNGSIRDNLLMIQPTVTEEQIWVALEFAAADQFVKRLPMGVDTLVGDRGVRLSGGERQRLVIARAILRKPSILVLDEATSALDTENESKIQEAIERLKGTMTIIVIAHRLSTIRNADQVIVLDQGEIIQQGQFNQLASEKKGVFSSLLRKQMGVSV